MNTLLQPDVCVCEDYRWTHSRKLPLQPETALMLAVLEEAITTFQKFAFSNSPRGKNLFRDVDRWIRAEDYNWPFSFNNICELLDLEPTWLRSRLHEWKEQPQGRSRTVKTHKARRVVGDRFGVSLGRKSSPQRLRVTNLALEPKLRNTRRAGKLTHGASHRNDQGILLEHRAARFGQSNRSKAAHYGSA